MLALRSRISACSGQLARRLEWEACGSGRGGLGRYAARSEQIGVRRCIQQVRRGAERAVLALRPLAGAALPPSTVTQTGCERQHAAAQGPTWLCHSLPPFWHRRQQRQQSLVIDRVAKGLSIMMWGASALRFLAHGAWLEALVAFACCLTAALLLAASLHRRCCYARYMQHTTTAALLQAHAAAAFVCATGQQMLAGRCVLSCGTCCGMGGALLTCSAASGI